MEHKNHLGLSMPEGEGIYLKEAHLWSDMGLILESLLSDVQDVQGLEDLTKQLTEALDSSYDTLPVGFLEEGDLLNPSVNSFRSKTPRGGAAGLEIDITDPDTGCSLRYVNGSMLSKKLECKIENGARFLTLERQPDGKVVYISHTNPNGGFFSAELRYDSANREKSGELTFYKEDYDTKIAKKSLLRREYGKETMRRVCLSSIAHLKTGQDLEPVIILQLNTGHAERSGQIALALAQPGNPSQAETLLEYNLG